MKTRILPVMLFLGPVLLHSFASAQAAFPPASRQAVCLSAGGYYAHLRVERERDGGLRVTAAQGFAYPIAQALQVSPEFSALQIHFAPAQCQGDLARLPGLHCLGNVNAAARTDGAATGAHRFSARAVFSFVPRTDGSFRTGLALQLAPGGKIGRAGYEFNRAGARYLGSCSFSN